MGAFFRRRMTGREYGKAVGWALLAIAALTYCWPFLMKSVLQATCVDAMHCYFLPIQLSMYVKLPLFIAFFVVVTWWTAARLRDAGQSTLLVLPALLWLLPGSGFWTVATAPWSMGGISIQLSAVVTCLLGAALLPTVAAGERSGAPRSRATSPFAWCWLGLGAMIVACHGFLLMLIQIIGRDDALRPVVIAIHWLDAPFALVPLAIVWVAVGGRYLGAARGGKATAVMGLASLVGVASVACFVATVATGLDVAGLADVAVGRFQLIMGAALLAQLVSLVALLFLANAAVSTPASGFVRGGMATGR